jgi:hypothetical protein
MIGVVTCAVIGFSPIDPINGFSRGAVIDGSSLSNYGTDCVHDRECEDYEQVCYIDLTTHRRLVS